MAEYENTFVREVKERSMTDASEILNWYRNLYHTEDNHTEQGIVAYAINDLFMEYKDVVPKSEVEWLYQTVDNYSQEVMYHDDITKMKVDEAKSEVAREIFEEIESLLYLNQLQGDIFVGKYFDADLENDIAELKKKYTGTCTPECKTYTLDVKNTEEKYFTPQDVRNMTPKEIHDNFSAIKRSMETWN